MQTNLPVFRVKESSVRRRFSDFEWLRNELERDSKIVVPALPSKAIKRQLPFRGDDGDSTHCHCECIFTSLCRDIWGGLHRGTPGRSGGFHQQDCRTPACTERTLPSHVSPGGAIFPHQLCDTSFTLAFLSLSLSKLVWFERPNSTGGEHWQNLRAWKDQKHLKRKLETRFVWTNPPINSAGNQAPINAKMQIYIRRRHSPQYSSNITICACHVLPDQLLTPYFACMPTCRFNESCFPQV